jgi:hypothetical protein
MALESSHQFGRIPGRFPSPMPSMTSAILDNSRGPISTPRASDTRTRFPIRAFSIGSAASTTTPQTPVRSGVQGNGLPPRLPTQQQHSQVFDAASNTITFSPEPRPSVNRNAASDPRYDRPTSRLGLSYGSPMRVNRRGRRRPDNASRTYGSSAIRNQNAPGFADSLNERFAISSRTAQQVHDGLKARLHKNITPNSNKGVVYIVRDPNRPNLLKIGAAKNFSQRKQQIERDCNLELEVVLVSDELENYTRAEHLVHGDLLHLCWRHTCLGCDTDHREWHEVSEDLAIRTMERWVRFMKEEQPYSGTGELKSIWTFLMHKRRPSSSTSNHDLRWRCWTHILQSPSIIDYCEHAFSIGKAHPIWWYIWDYSWQASSFLSWATVFILTMNFFALGVFFLSFICSCLSVASKSGKGRRL